MLNRIIKFKSLRHFVALVGLLMGIAGCINMPIKHAVSKSSGQPLQKLQVSLPNIQHDLLAQLLIAHMALAQADLKTALTAYDHAMMVSTEPGIAGQAVALALALHNDDVATAAIERWQALGATKASLTIARAQLAIDQGHINEARQSLQALISSGRPEAWQVFRQILSHARNQSQAALLLRTIAVPSQLPDDFKLWLSLSALGMKLGDISYAQDLAAAAIKRFHHAENYAWAAQLKAQAGDRKGAEALLQQGLANDPENIQLRVAYADMLSQDGDTNAAVKWLQQGPQNRDTYALRAVLAMRLNNQVATAQIYKQLQQSPPAIRQESYFLLGQLAEILHHDRQALAWYSRVKADDPNTFIAILRTAIILQAQGESSQAHNLLEQLQSGYNNNPQQLRQIYEVDAALYMSEQKYAQAATLYSRALRLYPKDWSLLYERGLAYAEDKQVDRAVADFRYLLKYKPTDVDASNALGFILADNKRDLPEAARLLSYARAARPNDPSIADSWGWLQYRLGHMCQAIQILQVAWQASKNTDIGTHLCEVLWQQNEKEQARQVWEEIRRKKPHYPTLDIAMRRAGL